MNLLSNMRVQKAISIIDEIEKHYRGWSDMPMNPMRPHQRIAIPRLIANAIALKKELT